MTAVLIRTFQKCEKTADLCFGAVQGKVIKKSDERGKSKNELVYVAFGSHQPPLMTFLVLPELTES